MQILLRKMGWVKPFRAFKEKNHHFEPFPEANWQASQYHLINTKKLFSSVAKITSIEATVYKIMSFPLSDTESAAVFEMKITGECFVRWFAVRLVSYILWTARLDINLLLAGWVICIHFDWDAKTNSRICGRQANIAMILFCPLPLHHTPPYA